MPAAVAVPFIEIESVSPERFIVQELMSMVTATFVVLTGTVTTQVCPVTAVATVPLTVKLTLHMTPDPVSEVETCVGSTLTMLMVSPVRSTGEMVRGVHTG